MCAIHVSPGGRGSFIDFWNLFRRTYVKLCLNKIKGRFPLVCKKIFRNQTGMQLITQKTDPLHKQFMLHICLHIQSNPSSTLQTKTVNINLISIDYNVRALLKSMDIEFMPFNIMISSLFNVRFSFKDNFALDGNLSWQLQRIQFMRGLWEGNKWPSRWRNLYTWGFLWDTEHPNTTWPPDQIKNWFESLDRWNDPT